MAIRNIRTDEDPLLRQLSKEVKEVTTRLKILIEDMVETMYFSEGVGLAAPQVGILKRVIVIDDRDGNKFNMINPKILEKSGNKEDIEACLSVIGRQGYVNRSTFVKVAYIDQEGQEQLLEASDHLARIIQHEIDHLDGILYIDRTDKVSVVEETEVVDEIEQEES